jgi:hypothetical protein
VGAVGAIVGSQRAGWVTWATSPLLRAAAFAEMWALGIMGIDFGSILKSCTKFASLFCLIQWTIDQASDDTREL